MSVFNMISLRQVALVIIFIPFSIGACAHKSQNQNASNYEGKRNPTQSCESAYFKSPNLTGSSQSRPGCFVSARMGNIPVEYNLTIPPYYSGEEYCQSDLKAKLPYVIYLHGRGSSKEEFQAHQGEKWLTALYSPNSQYDRRVLVVAPTEPKKSYWKNGPHGSIGTADMLTFELTQHIESFRCVKKNKRCLIGTSMGGHGVSYLKFRFQEIFPYAYAIAPIFRGATDLEDFESTYGGDNYIIENPIEYFTKATLGKTPSGGFPICCGYRATISDEDHLIDRNYPNPMYRRKQIEFLGSKCGSHRVQFSGEKGGHGQTFFNPQLKQGLAFCSGVLLGTIIDSECQQNIPIAKKVY